MMLGALLLASAPKLPHAPCSIHMAIDSATTIRLAEPSDFAAVAQLQLDTFIPAEDLPPPPPNPFAAFLSGGAPSASSRSGRAARLAVELEERVSRGADWLLVEQTDGDGDVLLGTVELSDLEMKLPTHGIAEGLYLSSMAVIPDARRSGLGKQLLEAAEKRAAAREAECIWLHVERANDAALGLYKGGGFKQQADTARHAAFTAALDLGQKEPLLLRKDLA